MRLRNDPKAKALLLEHGEIFIDYDMNTKPPIDWSMVFNNDLPIRLEIGMGKGQFVIQQAINHPEFNYIGLELNEVICAKAVKKYLALETKPLNLRFIKFNAKHLNVIFKPHSIQTIYLNFSDPWPKKRHTKNRLTSPNFLSLYQSVLLPHAVIEFKTDNESLYAYTLEVLQTLTNINLIYFTNDLYANLSNQYNVSNVATEYENKFRVLKNINKIIFGFK